MVTGILWSTVSGRPPFSAWLWLTSVCSGFVHLFRCSGPCSIQFSLSGFYSVKVFRCICFFQLLQAFFNRCFLIGRYFVTIFFQLLFSSKDQGISRVQFFNFLFCLFVRLSISFSFVFHLLDLSIC